MMGKDLEDKQQDAEIARLKAGYCDAHEPDGPATEPCGACEAVHQAERAEKLTAHINDLEAENERLREALSGRTVSCAKCEEKAKEE